ncbi:MAG TPA: 50S ribosomal protein L30 [Actinomycetota bacterium]|jgi:large subunit ribosomal protein L30|nr:50S ribosomal protein L30 [Actinomycetota bacterium]
MSQLKLTQVRSVVTRDRKQRGTIRALGLKRLGDTVVHDDKPEIRGMIKAVEHLLEVEETETA